MTTQIRQVSLEERRSAYDHVFGNVNVKATKRLSPTDPKAQIMREGKTARDKANGHIPGQNNVRFPESKTNARGRR